MIRNFSIGILILSFFSSNVDCVLADQVVEVPPIVVQPNDVQDITQQMIELDRLNRNQELAIKALIDEDQKRALEASAAKQDAALETLSQAMNKYSNYLISRDRARVGVNNPKASRYDDLISLTEEVDRMKGAGQTLYLKRDVIEEKYQILTQLKDEMTALNEKLKTQELNKDLNKTNNDQAQKIKLLTQRLAEMDQRISRYDGILVERDRQIAQLKTNTDFYKIKNQQDLVSMKQFQEEIKSVKNDFALHVKNYDQFENAISSLKNQANQLSAQLSQKQGQVDLLKSELESKIQQHDSDRTARDKSISWLNQVLAVTKNKAEYYKLTDQQDQQAIKDQADKLNSQLPQKQAQLDELKSELENKITAENTQNQQITKLNKLIQQEAQEHEALEARIHDKQEQNSKLDHQSQQDQQALQELKGQLKDKQDQIDILKAEVQKILATSKEMATSNAALKSDDRISLAKQLIDLQQKETVLLQEISELTSQHNTVFDQHTLALQNKIKALMSQHQLEREDLQSRISALKEELGQKGQQAGSLKKELENKIAEEKDQAVLTDQIQDLKGQLQDKTDRVTALESKIRSGQTSQIQIDSLKQQLTDEQGKIEELNQELNSKNAQSDQMSMMIRDYQKKLEAKNNVANQELKQSLTFKNGQAQVEEEISYLNAKNKELQVKDLNLAMMQDKLTAQLAKAHQQLSGLPSSDEIDFLRAGLQKATAELKQKDAMLFRVKANAQEYEKEYKAQSQDFQSLKDQLQDARETIEHKNEDLKYKDLEIARIKYLAKMDHGGHSAEYFKEFKSQSQEFQSLKQQLQDARNEIARLKGHSSVRFFKAPEGKADILQDQLMSANAQIKDLRKQLDEFIQPSKNDPVREKLKQALDKIDQQGRVINTLVQKLQDSGQTIDLTKF